MINRFAIAAGMAALTLTIATNHANSAQIVAETRPAGLAYATLTDRVLEAPIVVDATIRSAVKLKGAEAAGALPGRTRYYVLADIAALIRGPNAGMPNQIAYLVDVAPDSRGKAPKLKKLRVLLFARAVSGNAGEVQLVAPDAQLPWSPELDGRVRGIAREVVAADAPPAITGIGNAFHVAGSLPGEGETQIFLTTVDARPVSLSVLRRPGEQTRWAVALSEIVDESAAPPARETLLWYRLACGLPRALPDRAVASMEPADAGIAREDYAFVLDALGSCRS